MNCDSVRFNVLARNLENLNLFPTFLAPQLQTTLSNLNPAKWNTSRDSSVIFGQLLLESTILFVRLIVNLRIIRKFLSDRERRDCEYDYSQKRISGNYSVSRDSIVLKRRDGHGEGQNHS
jgi:hypothetical protein